MPLFPVVPFVVIVARLKGIEVVERMRRLDEAELLIVEVADEPADEVA
jgi:hypothetical protein